MKQKNTDEMNQLSPLQTQNTIPNSSNSSEGVFVLVDRWTGFRATATRPAPIKAVGNPPFIDVDSWRETGKSSPDETHILVSVWIRRWTVAICSLLTHWPPRKTASLTPVSPFTNIV